MYHNIQTPLLSDEFYYKYDSDHDRVYPGWPRRIADDFGPREGLSDGVPDNIDSVFFDKRDKMLYFFKNDDVSTVRLTFCIIHHVFDC